MKQDLGHALWLRDLSSVRATGLLEPPRQLVCHRAVSSMIIGPPMMEHLGSGLAADDIDVSCDPLDRIDEIGPPEHTVRVVHDVWSVAGWRRLWR